MQIVEKIIKQCLKKLGVNFPCFKYRVHSFNTYCPWLEKVFQEMYRKVKDYTVVTEDRCYILYKFASYCSHLKGDFAECGVYKGGTAFIIAQALKNSSDQNKRLHLFDTFVGMPAIAEKDPSGHKKGDFGDTSLEAVKRCLQIFPFVSFHPGFIPKTFETVKDRIFAFVHVDVDLYQTTFDCCNFFYERLVSGGVMICDDYGFPSYKFSASEQ